MLANNMTQNYQNNEFFDSQFVLFSTKFHFNNEVEFLKIFGNKRDLYKWLNILR